METALAQTSRTRIVLATMFRFIRKLFSKTPAALAPGSVAEELWKADLSSVPASGFEPASDERYGIRSEDNSLLLELKKGNLFAWTNAGSMRYADASIELEIDFGEPGQKRSAGVLFRKAEESSFMYVLVSSDGNVRLDAVFNGDPRTLVPWVACPWADGSRSMVLSLVARGPRFVVLLNGRFALEAEDDSLETGGLAFAAQTYEAAASFRLVSFRIESRPFEVETDYIRYARVITADADQRRRLAEGLYALGFHVAALVQLRKISDMGQASARDSFMEAECLIGLDLTAEALSAIDACLAIDPTMEQAIEERFNLLYLTNDYEHLRTALENDPDRLAGNPRLANLLGHAYYNGGSWKEAAKAYGQAATGDPAMPLYARNHAMSLEKTGEREKAAAAWLTAAQGFYSQEAWDDTEECSRKLRTLGYDKTALDLLDALVFYGRGNHGMAETILARLHKKNRTDAPGSYVYGLILSEKGKRADAIRAFRRAAELEPEKALYHYRLAESLFLSGEQCGAELDSALSLAPEDGWTMNLAGQVRLSAGDAAGASRWFTRASQALPGEPVVFVNLSEAYSVMGQQDEAIRVLGDWPERSAQAANRLGNALITAGRLHDATDAYRTACSLGEGEPDTVDYRINLAAVLIELGELSEAEECLRKALETRDDARALMLMGDLATEYGDSGRAELAYRATLEREPGNQAVLVRLARHYLTRGVYEKAEAMASLIEAERPETASSIRADIRAATYETVSCSSCGKSWDVPKPMPAVPKVTLRGELPDDAPAGSCPDCGKVFCVACRKHDLVEDRFTCPGCGTRLNLNDNRIRWLVRESVQRISRD